MRIGLAKKDSYRGTPLWPVQHIHDILITQLNKTKDIIFTEDVRTMSFVGDHFKYKIHKWRMILISLLNQVLAKEKCTKRTWIIINEKSQVKHHNITALILSQDELISYTNLLHLFVLKRCSLYRSTFQCYIQDVDHSHSNQFMLMWGHVYRSSQLYKKNYKATIFLCSKNIITITLCLLHNQKS